MKKNILSFIAAMLCVFTISAQKNAVNNDKYRINLPDYWKPGSKVWQILTDKLPEVCEELRDKELCGDHCNPKYTIEFYMTAPDVHGYHPIHISSDFNSSMPTESWEISTYYSFQCYLLLFDDKSKLLAKIVLTDTDEVWTLKNRASLRSNNISPRYRLAVQNAINTSGQQGETPYSYINQHKDELEPKLKDLFSVIDSRIKSL